jgi:hypothetical protein
MQLKFFSYVERLEATSCRRMIYKCNRRYLPVIFGVTPCLEHQNKQIEAHYYLVDDRSLSKCRCDVLAKTCAFMSTDNFSICFNLNRLGRWPTNEATEYTDIRSTTQQQQSSMHEEESEPCRTDNSKPKAEGLDEQQLLYTCSCLGTFNSKKCSTVPTITFPLLTAVGGDQRANLHRGDLGIHMSFLKWPNSLTHWLPTKTSLLLAAVGGEQWEKLHKDNLGIHMSFLKWPNSQVQWQIDNSAPIIYSRQEGHNW